MRVWAYRRYLPEVLAMRTRNAAHAFQGHSQCLKIVLLTAPGVGVSLVGHCKHLKAH